MKSEKKRPIALYVFCVLMGIFLFYCVVNSGGKLTRDGTVSGILPLEIRGGEWRQRGVTLAEYPKQLFLIDERDESWRGLCVGAKVSFEVTRFNESGMNFALDKSLAQYRPYYVVASAVNDYAGCPGYHF
jgi:hypothetical protein